MIVTIKVNNCSDMAVASTEAEIMGLPITRQDTSVFDVVVTEKWKLDYFLSKIGHADIIRIVGEV